MDLNKIWDVLLEIRDSQTKTEADLSYHIKRTDTLEQAVADQRKHFDERVESLEKVNAGWVFTGKLLAAVLSTAGTILGIIIAIKGLK